MRQTRPTTPLALQIDLNAALVCSIAPARDLHCCPATAAAAAAAAEPGRDMPSSPRSRPQGVCPGDALMALPETGVVRIGGGVQQDGEQLVATKAGLLQQARNGKLWVEARQKR